MTVRILLGDVREKLAELPDESVHCVVTSPPYFGLRDYGTGSWEGGDPACDHKGPPRQSQQSTLAGNGHGNGKQLSPALQSLSVPFGQSCGKCGATRTDKQIGLEPTPAEFVAVMVEVFREVRRVLRKDGTLWLNLGDSYSGSGKGAWDVPDERKANIKETYRPNVDPVKTVTGLKSKDLIGIPWRVAFALQADGWYLRQDIIWAKPNPMPESVTDRCTKAHEYLFLLSKSARYFYDQEAIREDWTSGRDDMRENGVRTGTAYLQQGPVASNSVKTKKPDGWATHGGGHGSFHKEGREKGEAAEIDPTKGRNRRSVWTVATQPFKEAHFATFPPDLIEPCIKAGCPKDCCAKCGAPVVREVERTAMMLDRSERTHEKGLTRSRGTMLEPPTCVTTGWAPSCSCNEGVMVRGTLIVDEAGTRPGVVLDCFGGAGTTGLVADRLGRDAVLIELNPQYAELARERIKGDAPLFAEIAL